MLIRARNVNDAFQKAVNRMGGAIYSGEARKLGSRQGPVYEWPTPVMTIYDCPQECVLWDSTRDCNPFFHLMEALWMLAGRNDVAFLAHYNGAITSLVDDGEGVQHGAYGFRWLSWFGFDQLAVIADMLVADPTTRRAVLGMWSPNGDLVCADGGAGGQSSKDLPCNLSVAFSARSGKLDMTVFNRSNDIIFGCYGANAVHFSILQQYMSAMTGIPIGVYTQFSANWHTYHETWIKKARADARTDPDLYPCDGSLNGPVPHDLICEQDIEDAGGVDAARQGLRGAIRQFVNDGPLATGREYSNHFIADVAVPLRDIWNAWKAKDRGRALALMSVAEDKFELECDWFTAARKWMERRAVK